MRAPNPTLAVAALSCLAILAAPGLVRAQVTVPSPGEDPPAAVSPGGAAEEVIQSRCPTFSWTESGAAEGYELVVYRLEDEATGPGGSPDESEADPAARVRLPAGSTTWTPSLERCLDRGWSYAWSVGAVGEAETVEWSEASLFRVSGTPDALEVEAALDTLERYLDEAGDGGGGEAGADPPAEGRLAGSEAARAAESHRELQARALQAAADGDGTAGEEPEPAAASDRSEFDFFVQGGSFAGGDVVTGGDFGYGSPKSYTKWIGPYHFVANEGVQGLFEYKHFGGYVHPVSDGDLFLAAPVELPEGAEITFVACAYYDNDETTDIQIFRFDLYSRLVSSTAVSTLAEATTSSSGDQDQVRMVVDDTIADDGNPVENGIYDYFLWVQMLTMSGSECNDECRFYGCRIGYTASVLHPAG